MRMRSMQLGRAGVKRGRKSQVRKLKKESGDTPSRAGPYFVSASLIDVAR